jgi:hypothetical protein
MVLIPGSQQIDFTFHLIQQKITLKKETAMTKSTSKVMRPKKY